MRGWLKKRPVAICVQCAYCRDTNSSGWGPLCYRSATKQVDVVYGGVSTIGVVPCSAERDRGRCGPKGRCFQAIGNDLSRGGGGAIHRGDLMDEFESMIKDSTSRADGRMDCQTQGKTAMDRAIIDGAEAVRPPQPGKAAYLR